MRMLFVFVVFSNQTSCRKRRGKAYDNEPVTGKPITRNYFVFLTIYNTVGIQKFL